MDKPFFCVDFGYFFESIFKGVLTFLAEWCAKSEQDFFLNFVSHLCLYFFFFSNGWLFHLFDPGSHLGLVKSQEQPFSPELAFGHSTLDKVRFTPGSMRDWKR